MRVKTMSEKGVGTGWLRRLWDVLLPSSSVWAGAAVQTAIHLRLLPPLFPAAQYTYLIGAGDTLSVIVWRNPDLSMSIPVRPDGKITMPLVEDLPVAGKDPTPWSPARSKPLCPNIFGTQW